MITTEEKFDLIIEAASLCLKQEFRGDMLDEHLPKVSIVVSKDPKEKGGIDIYTDIRVEYSNGKIGETTNWSGLATSVDESLTSNIRCLQFEIEKRLVAYQAMLDRLRAAEDVAGSKLVYSR